MAIAYSDSEISSFVEERKPLSKDWRARLRRRVKRGHSESELSLTVESGREFRIILRQNTVNQFDFSVILAVLIPHSNRLFRLRRYNGKSHEHTNSLEGETFYDYHIHMATERYQEIGAREDAFAQVTDRYQDLDGALDCLIEDACFEAPPDPQLSFLQEM